jgi:hypothetical protein
MKTPLKWIAILLTLSAFVNIAVAQQHSKVTEQKTIKSAILSKALKYIIYHPTGCGTFERICPGLLDAVFPSNSLVLNHIIKKHKIILNC